MNRRELLGAVGLGATGMAGLVGGSAGQDDGTTTTATTTAGEGDGFTGVDSSADQPFATVSVGTREGVRNPENNRPHAVRVWNDSEQARTVELRLVRNGGSDGGNGEAGASDGDAGPAVLDRNVEFPADGYLTLRLLEPGSYALTVQPNGGGGETIRIPRSRFDCNDSRTDVAVTADGEVRSVTVTTEAGCPPEVTDRTFTAFGGSCGSADEAGVAFGAESVTVTGSIQVPNPCYGAELAEVSVPSADALRVTVATTEPTADVCIECVGTVEYRADLGFRDRVPGTVEVVHRRDDGTETVATVTRGDGTTTTDGGVTTGTGTETGTETATPDDAETTTGQ